MPLLGRYLKNKRVQRVAPHIGGAVLDLGCGPASILRTFGKSINSYCGIDMSSKLIHRLTEEFPNQEFHTHNLDNDPIEFDSRFDCVTMVAFIEHIFNQKLLMDGVFRALRPGGRVVLTTPTPFGNDFVHRLGSAWGLFSKTATNDHIVLYNKFRLRILGDEVGLKLIYHRYFQLHCNQIAIFQKPAATVR